MSLSLRYLLHVPLYLVDNDAVTKGISISMKMSDAVPVEAVKVSITD